MSLCKINDNYIEFNMCSLSKPKFTPVNSCYLGRGKIMNNDGIIFITYTIRISYDLFRNIKNG